MNSCTFTAIYSYIGENIGRPKSEIWQTMVHLFYIGEKWKYFKIVIVFFNHIDTDIKIFTRKYKIKTDLLEGGGEKYYNRKKCIKNISVVKKCSFMKPISQED